MNFIFIVSIVIIVFAVQCIFNNRPKKYPPGPKWYPFVGNIFTVIRKKRELKLMHSVWNFFIEKYGPIVGLKLGRDRVVIISDRELIKEVSSREEFEGRPDGFFWRMRADGKRLGLVFVDGPQWIEQRAFCVQSLKEMGFGKRTMEDLINEEVMDLVNLLKNSTEKLREVNEMFDIHILNTMWSLLAGKRFARTNEMIRKVRQAIRENFRLLDASGGLLHQLPIIRFFIPKASGYVAYTTNHKIMKTFINDIIEDHKYSPEFGDNRDLIDVFLNKMKNENDKYTSYTEDQLRILCLDFLLAGTDTTSNTLQFCILFMTKYPDIQKKVQNEIDSIIGENRSPQFSDNIKMPYTRAVLLEIQRMANVAPAGIPRRTYKATTLAGYNIPKDTTILLLLYNVNMDNKHWGDSHNFRPERFLDKDGKLIKDDFLLTFGYGRRKCIGENFAKANIFLFFVNIFKRFNAIKDPEDKSGTNIEFISGISLAPKPFKVSWELRK